MTKQYLLMTTILSTSILLGSMAPSFAADTITTNTVTTSNAPISKEALADPRVAAERFVAHVNYARVALAMKNGELARQHITQARNMVTIITNATPEQRRISDVAAGRVNYDYDLKHKYNYFPIEAGRVEVKQVSDGPIWAKNSLAVSDAEVVSLSLDLTNDKAENYLSRADADIVASKYMEAEAELGELTDAVVTIDSKVSIPLDKARDNIGIAQAFIQAKNYDGARYALTHADEALDAMQKDEAYKEHFTDIIAMRKEVKDMRDVTTKKDPTTVQKVSASIDKWSKELTAWVKSK